MRSFLPRRPCPCIVEVRFFATLTSSEARMAVSRFNIYRSSQCRGSLQGVVGEGQTLFFFKEAVNCHRRAAPSCNETVPEMLRECHTSRAVRVLAVFIFVFFQHVIFHLSSWRFGDAD